MQQLKEQTVQYWTKRVEGFSALRKKEFLGEKHDQWLRELMSYLPHQEGLSILDIGTGTGFFSMLLAAASHHVTGIDLTADMIEEAKRISASLHLPATFLVMDAENPDFAPASFDAIVTRNLTWCLPHLPEAYCAWHRILKPGGLLLNFDADYCREAPAPALPAHHAHQDIAPNLMEEYEAIKKTLRACQQPRPQWDVALLQQAGFRDITVDPTVWKRIYNKQDEFFNPTPIFTIAARA